MERRSFGTGTRWEAAFGYARAVRIGPHVWVAGTTAIGSDGRIAAPDDAGTQTRQAFQNVEQALEELGASLADVVRTRLHVTDIRRDGEAVGTAHGEVFGEIRPVTAMGEVARLIEPAMRVEVEAEAFVRGNA